MEGRLLGAQDGVLLRLDPLGACLGASVVGASGTDEFAIAVAATDDAIFLAGEGRGPLTQRDLAGDETGIGGREGGWLVRLADDGTRDIWSVGSRGARGRGLAVDSQAVYWSFTAPPGDLRRGDEVVGAVEDGVSVMRLSTGDAIETWWLGPGTRDTMDIAISSAGVFVPATGFDYRSHVRIALIDGDGLRSFRNDVSTPYPFVAAAEGSTVWMAGSTSSTPVVLGFGEVEVPLESAGGIFVVRFAL